MIATPDGWSAWCATCCAWRASTPSRKRLNSPARLATLFRSVSPDLSERIESQHLRIDVTVDSAAALIEADPTKMHDALRNLIENAVNYSANGGHIELAGAGRWRYALLSVGDFGPGFSSIWGTVRASLSRGQVAHSRSWRHRPRAIDRAPPGQLHGGKVSAANRPEGGAVFTISLPHTRNR